MDLNAALARLQGRKDALADLLQLFQVECPKLMNDIRRAISREDSAALRIAAHTLKGSANILMARPVVDAAWRLESMGRDGNLQQASKALEMLEQQVARLQRAVKEQLEAPAAER